MNDKPTVGDTPEALLPSIAIIGKGFPEVGGMAAHLEALDATFARRHPAWRFINLSRADREGVGRFSASNVRRTIEDIRRVRREAQHVELLHFHSAFVPASTILRAWALLRWGARRGQQAIVHLHGGGLPRWMARRPQPMRRLLARLALRRATTVLTASHLLRDTVSSLHPSVRFLANAVDVSLFRPADAGTAPPPIPIVLYAGVITENKGLLELYAASRALRQRGVVHELHIAGGAGSDAAESHRLQAAAPDGTRFLGVLDQAEMAERYRCATIFCLPSRFEAMPISVIEAMASGCPVVATDVGQVAETLGGAGTLVPPRDPDALAIALERYLLDVAARTVSSSAGRRRAVDHFSNDRLHDALCRIYRDAGA